MLKHEPTTVSVTADLRLRVPRSAPGSLIDGTRRAIEAVDAVARVESIQVTGITPNLNDVFVDATLHATVTLDTPDPNPDPESIRSLLTSGFGIDDVTHVTVR